MRSLFIKIYSFSLGFLFSFGLAVSIFPVHAQDNPAQIPEQIPGQNINSCTAGYRQFLSSILGYEGLMDYWEDIFVRSSNPCYYRDIRSIEERLRRSRELVRSSFLRCDLDNLDNLTEANHRLEAELYFLRRAVIKNDEGIFVVSRLDTPESRRELEKEMRQFFVIDRSLITDEQMRNYVNIFEAKYEGRIEDYNQCRSLEIYGDIEEKFTAFWEQMKSLGAGFSEAFTEEIATERSGRPEDSEGSESFLESLANRIAGIVDFVEIEPQFDLADLQERLDPSIPPPTFENVRFTLERSQEIFDTQTSRADLLQRYEALYGHIADNAVSQILEKQDQLIEILKGSEPAMEDALQCLSETESRECQNQ